jgi:nucleoprotein TPR
LAHYRVIADDREKALNELQQTNDEYRATIEQRLKDTEAALKQTKESLEALHNKYDEQQNAFASYQETAGQEIENLHAQVTKVEKEKRDMTSQLEEALSKEAALRQDLNTHKEMCAEAQNNYDREVMIHANSLSLLSKIKVSPLPSLPLRPISSSRLTLASIEHCRRIFRSSRTPRVRQLRSTSSWRPPPRSRRCAPSS